MPRRARHDPEEGQGDLLALLAEQERGPAPCPHLVIAKSGYAWEHERDPESVYHLEWVHADPHCRRSKFPGRKQPLPNVGWSRELQKDVAL